MVHKALETVVAFANTEGGFLVLGFEDIKKAKGVDRLFMNCFNLPLVINLSFCAVEAMM